MAIAAEDLPAVAAAASGLGSGGGKQPNPAARLGVAILLFWLAGLCMFLAFGQGVNDLGSWGGKGSGFTVLRQAIQSMFSRGGDDIAQAEGGGNQ